MLYGMSNLVHEQANEALILVVSAYVLLVTYLCCWYTTNLLMNFCSYVIFNLFLSNDGAFHNKYLT